MLQPTTDLSELLNVGVSGIPLNIQDGSRMNIYTNVYISTALHKA